MRTVVSRLPYHLLSVVAIAQTAPQTTGSIAEISICLSPVFSLGLQHG
ncbi:hypothetical protein [Olivibacter sitiensis]|nr:hypothetical protein [Olivibacter sitiensis]